MPKAVWCRRAGAPNLDVVAANPLLSPAGFSGLLRRADVGRGLAPAWHQMLVRRLRSLCQLAGERHLAFRGADEAAVRLGLRELGNVLPPTK